MNCQVIQEQLVDDLACHRDEEIRRHLTRCPECRDLCKDLRVLEELAKDLSNHYEVPPHFSFRVLAEAAKSRSARFWALRPLYIALLLVMLSVGFLGVMDGTREHDAGTSREEVVAAQESAENPEPRFVEVIIEDAPVGDMILRLPSVIEIRQTDLHEDFAFENIGY